MGGNGGRLAVLAVTLALMLMAAWLEMPEWQREAAALAWRRKARRVVAAAARVAGRSAMRDELAGRRAEADAGYSLARRLSELRDRL